MANIVKITAPAHGLSDGDYVKIDNVVGMTQLNTNAYIVSNSDTNTFELKDLSGNYITGANFDLYVSGGQVRKMITSVGGLDYLEGETVSVVVDGGLPSSQQTFVVSGGTITLLHRAAVIHIGLPYIGKIKFLMLSDGSHTTGQTKNRRLYKVALRLFQSLGMKFGQTEAKVNRVYFSRTSDPMGHAPSLFTGDYEVKTFDAWWDKEIEPVILQTDPLPLMILSAVFFSEVEEK